MQAIATQVHRAFGRLALSMAAGAAPAYALPTSGVATYYFSNATFTTEVGYSVLGCSGTRSSAGLRTRYAATERFACGGQPSA